MDTNEIEVEEVTDGEENANKRNCNHCGREYTFKTRRSKFCSDKCRSLHGMNNRMNGPVTSDSGNEDNYSVDQNNDDDDDDKFEHRSDAKSLSITKMSSSLRGLDPQSQYIISHQEKTIDDLKAIRRRLEDKLEKVTDQRNDLQKKVDRMDLEQSLNLQAKSGLNGLGENPIVQKLVEHLAPVAGKWLEGVVTKQTGSGQLTGAEELTPEVQQQLAAIVNWYGKLPPETQQIVFGVLDAFAECEDPKKLEMLLKRVTNIINGTAKNGHNSYAPGIFPN